MTNNLLEPKKKKGRRKKLKSLEMVDDISKVKSRKKKNKKNKTLKNLKPKSKKKANNISIEKKVIEVVEKAVTETPQCGEDPNSSLRKELVEMIRINSNPVENLIEPNGIKKNQDPIIGSNRFFYITPRTNYFLILSIISIILFMVGGYVFPATEEDITYNKVIWTNDGNYERGLFNQFYTSISFTLGVFLLGFYINSTFIKLNVKNWNLFALGILLMFMFGLGKIGELVYNHNIFNVFIDLVLPIALIVLAFASHKIYKDLTGVI